MSNARGARPKQRSATPARHVKQERRRALEALIGEAATDCYGDEDCVFGGFVVGIEDNVPFPFPAETLGEEVSVLGVDSRRSNLRAGIIMLVSKGGRTYPSSLAALVVPPTLQGREHIEAYFKWASLPLPQVQLKGGPHSRFSARQGQYLAYIAQYTRIHGCPPAENEIARYIGVTGPAAHTMVVSLAARGLIERTPGVPRSIQLLVPSSELPELQGPADPASAGPPLYRPVWRRRR